MKNKDKVVAARDRLAAVFSGVVVEYTGSDDRFIFTWGEHHCEAGPLALERGPEEIARSVGHAFIELNFD